MKMVKSLLLGTAAGLVAMTGAQAADLPVKAKPVQYVKVCSLYGAGFYYIPGTDTCLKVGGWVRAETNWNAGGSFNPFHVATLDSRGLNQETTRTRGIITLDARAQTEYGTLRSYIAGGFQSTNGTGGEIYAPRAFVQWAGFTAGRAQSFFDFYVTPAYSNTTNIWASDTGGGGDDVFAYTAQFGNGLSASLSLEDTSTRRTTIFGDGGYAGRQWYDMVANLRMDQAWGSAQIMGAAHQLRTAGGVAGDEWGYAVGAGVTVKLPMLGKADSISTQVTYAKGALKYVGSGLSSLAITNNGSTAYGPVFDSVVIGTNQELTEGWSIVGGFQHGWNAHWKTSLYGTYGAISYSDAACGTGGGFCDWSMYQIGSRTVWTPVANLDLSVDVMYNHINSSGIIPSISSNPASDQGWWQGIFRVQRNFYP